MFKLTRNHTIQLLEEALGSRASGSNVFNTSASFREAEEQNLSTTIIQAQKLVHTAVQPATSILLLSQILTQGEKLDRDVLLDLATISEQALALQDILQSLQKLLNGEEV